MHREHGLIRELAYRLWKARGCPAGSPEYDWLEAERQLSTGKPAMPSEPIDGTLQNGFPAGDPPASRLPDEPPVNAPAKWATAGAARKNPGRRAAAARRRSKPSDPK